MFTFREEDNEEAAGGGEQLTTDEGVLATEPVQSVHGHQHSGHHEHACHIQNTFSFAEKEQPSEQIYVITVNNLVKLVRFH